MFLCKETRMYNGAREDHITMLFLIEGFVCTMGKQEIGI